MKSKVLLIDDNTEILEFIEDTISGEYEVLKTDDPLQVELLLETHLVSLIVSDVMMPQMNGFELCQRLKTSTDWCHIPIILLTAKNTLSSRIEGLELGADAYIEKPFSPKHLKVQIKNLLDNRDVIRNYFAHSPLAHLKLMANNHADQLFLEKLNQIIVDNLDKPELHIQTLAELLCVSRPTLYRKIRSISNLTLSEIITLARLKKAAELLAEGNYRISEVSNVTGFSSPNHFSRTFLKEFKMSPTMFLKTVEQSKSL